MLAVDGGVRADMETFGAFPWEIVERSSHPHRLVEKQSSLIGLAVTAISL